MNISDEEMIGKKFGRLTVIEKTKIQSKTMWKCICDCQSGKNSDDVQWTYVEKWNLISGGTKSCGCLHKEKCIENGRKNKKYNRYDLISFDYGVGYTANGDIFYFDKSDYDLIYQNMWHKHQDGYMRTCTQTYKDENGKRHNKYIMMHQLLMNAKEVDHIDGNPANNQRSNLRLSNHSKNMKNLKLYTNNTSGHKGVHYNKREKSWVAYITCNCKKIHLGYFQDKLSAIDAREQAELKYFGNLNRAKEHL